MVVRGDSGTGHGATVGEEVSRVCVRGPRASKENTVMGVLVSPEAGG